MNMKKLMVALFAGFAGVMTVNADPMFYIGETGYDSWADVYTAAKNDDTIVVGKDAKFGMSGNKILTIDLNGGMLEWLNSGWMYGHLTFVDSIGGGKLKLADNGNRNVGGGTTDISSLTASQLTGTGKFWVNSETEIKFPQGMSLEDSKSRIANPQANMKIVVQGVTYTYDGSAWISDSPATTYSITITPPQNGTLETSVTNDVAAGTTVTVTATPATGCQLKSVTMNGAAITGNTFVMPAADVTLAATFEAQSTPPVDPPSGEQDLAWVTSTYVPADWTPLANNILAGKSGSTSGTLAWGGISKDTAKLTNGTIPVTPDNDEIVGFCDSSEVSWTFDEPQTIAQIRITSRKDANTGDAATQLKYAGIFVADVFVKKSGSSDWIALGVPLSLKNSSSDGAMMAVLSDAGVGPFVSDVVALKIKFVKGEVVWIDLAEIEAVESTSPVAPVQGTVFTIE